MTCAGTQADASTYLRKFQEGTHGDLAEGRKPHNAAAVAEGFSRPLDNEGCALYP